MSYENDLIPQLQPTQIPTIPQPLPPISIQTFLYMLAPLKAHIIIYSSRNTIRIKQMQKQFSLFDRLRQERELKQLREELSKREEQLGLKDGRIEELQRRVMELMGQEIGQNIAIEEEIQCSIDHEVEADRGQLVQQMRGLLAELQEKEEQSLGLHLALLTKERKMDDLESQLLRKEEQTQQMQDRLSFLQSNMQQQDAVLLDLKNSNNDLLERTTQLQEQLLIKESEVAELQRSQQNLSVRSKEGQTEQDIMNQNQRTDRHQESREMRKSREMREVAERDLVEMTEQAEKMKKIINNYDWKLFCLETELDLSNKEKKQYRYVNDKNQMRIGELESQIKHQTIKVYGLEEDLKLMAEENKKMQMEVIRKQMKVDELLDEIDELKEGKEEQENEEMKELRYRIQEKDEQLKEITNYLKEKINENHEFKLKASQLEKSLQESQKKAEKIEFGSYQLEQNIIEYQELIQKQTEKIDECTNENQFLSQKLNDLSLMNILRVQEFQAKVANLEALVKEKSAKVNELSVEIIEREIQFNKKVEELNEQIEEIRQQLEEVQTAKEDIEGSIQAYERQADNLVQEIQRTNGKARNHEQSLKEKDKIIESLKANIESLEQNNQQFRAALEQLVEKYEQDERLNEQKLKILKQEAAEYRQKEQNYLSQIKSLKNENAKLRAERSSLEVSLAKQAAASQQMRKEVNDLHSLTKQRMQEMLTFLTHPASQETTTFELLDEDDFQVMTCQKQEMRKRLQSFSSQLTTICGRHLQ